MLTINFFYYNISIIRQINSKRKYNYETYTRRNKEKRQHVSGFRARMSTPGGQEVINRRRAKGRHKLAITAKERA